MKELISEKIARSLIFILFVITLVGALLLFLSAHFSQTVRAEFDPAADMQRQQEFLAYEAQVTTEMQALETKLNEALAANAALSDQNVKMAEENQELAVTRESLMESFGMTYVGDFYATSYCAEEYPHICGGNGVTASGTKPTPGITCAADWSVFPAGTWLYIEGVGMRRVEDTGSAIKGNRLDVVVDTHANALAWGGQGNHAVWVLG